MIYQIQQEKIISSMINRINQELNLDNIDQSILILDFSKVNFMDSEGISWIVDILNTLDKKGIGLKIINVKKEVYKIFEKKFKNKNKVII